MADTEQKLVKEGSNLGMRPPPLLRDAAANTQGRPCYLWRVVPVGLLCAALALAVIGVTGFFRLSRDARSLRSGIIQADAVSPGVWHKKIELSFGALSFHALRAGLSFLPLPEEARLALRSVSGAEVGVYRRGQRAGEMNVGAMLAAADKAMAGRGWDRAIGVVGERQLVLVYVPQVQGNSTRLPACVAVLQDNQLVLVAARSDLEPLLELALRGKGSPGQKGWLAARF